MNLTYEKPLPPDVEQFVDKLTHNQLRELHRSEKLNFRVYGDRRKTEDLRASLKRWLRWIHKWADVAKLEAEIARRIKPEQLSLDARRRHQVAL